VTDPRGHSYGRHSNPPATFEHDRWWDCKPFVRGIVLFNRGYYWEAHEEWESVWHTVGRTGPVADFIKGLIKWAAAGVKAREGRTDGVARHLRRASELLVSAREQLSQAVFAGQTLDAIIDAINAAASSPTERARDGSPLVLRLFRLVEPVPTDVTDSPTASAKT
jgi:predicted metal-dependent hydrolase